MRRTRVQGRADEEFIKQYRPWDSADPWEVRVRFRLADGRNVELKQELSERMDSHALDVDFGRDYSNEIINEGSPDGSVWLGLDRRSFLSTACVRQSQLLDVLTNPDVLHTHLQRAAATCAVNSNGAKALQLIESYRAEFVGEDRANSTRPLYRALRRVDVMKGSLGAAKTEHLRYLHLMASENEVRARLEQLRRELNLGRAAIADRDANDWERRLQRAQSVLTNYPERPTGDVDRLNNLVREVSTALRIWQERPEMPDLSGPTSVQLEDQLQQLPARPTGDLEPDAQVLKAEAEYLAGKYSLTLHIQSEPPQAVFPKTGELTLDQLRQIASSLEEVEPEGDPLLDELAKNPINERLIHRVYTAIEVFERRPKPMELSRPTAQEIRRVIETLPSPAEGDLEPTSQIIEAANGYASAKEALRQNGLNRPGAANYPDINGTTPGELRTLAIRLREPVVMSGFSNKIRARSAGKRELEQLGKTRTLWVSAAGGVSLLALVPLAILMAKQQPAIVGGAFALFAFMVWLVARWKTRPINAKRRELEEAQEQAEAPDSSTMDRRFHKEVTDRIEKLHVPSSPEALEQLANELESAQDADRMNRLWKETQNRLEKALQAATEKLRSLLDEKLAGDVPNVEEGLAQYQRGCADRSHTAALASRRLDLERQLAAKTEAEASATAINQQREAAEAELQEVARLCKVTAENDADLIQRLNDWVNECDRIKRLQSELGQKALVRVAWKQRQLEKRELLLKNHLPVDLPALRKLSAEVEQAQAVKAAHERWSATLSRLTREYDSRAAQLTRLLEKKEVEISEDLEDVLRRYREACEARALIAVEAKRRPDVERQLMTRRQVEDAAAKVSAQRQNAHQELLTVAEHAGLPETEEEQLAENLRRWLHATTNEIRDLQEGLKEWLELDTVLEGKTFQEFKEKVQLHREHALVLGSGFSSEELTHGMANLAHYEATVGDLAVEVDATSQELANIQGQIHSYEERPVSVSDAEEELRTAEEELAHLRTLDDTLETTHVFLSHAQDSVHKDIAPFLADIVRRWLPEITLGRYVDARVDSSSLEIQVCDQAGEWRDASRLSHGTAEQIYLLLRIAMVEYLTKPNEVCPMILDDITLQSDARRKERILATLKKVSERRQVILFTQEEEVLRWARKHLSEPEGRVIELSPALAE
jgi:hypothetical protein